ncbi:MAG: hypothetical protein NZ703_13990 [Gemmataceae bacterium]|nr:hypothetical protein [Gemmataceae bacterium]MCS7272188.1 hypothetical protein [Gemmataceae bacterium]MDW8244274.1 hypothetical protein [Thermogemmata sp.]
MNLRTLTLKQRKSIFQALVKAQDQGIPVPESKRRIIDKYHLTPEQLELIEEEGLEKEWPPLNEQD